MCIVHWVHCAQTHEMHYADYNKCMHVHTSCYFAHAHDIARIKQQQIQTFCFSSTLLSRLVAKNMPTYFCTDICLLNKSCLQCCPQAAIQIETQQFGFQASFSPPDYSSTKSLHLNWPWKLDIPARPGTHCPTNDTTRLWAHESWKYFWISCWSVGWRHWLSSQGEPEDCFACLCSMSWSPEELGTQSQMDTNFCFCLLLKLKLLIGARASIVTNDIKRTYLARLVMR